MTGIELIAAERKRQVEQEGWSPEHDDQHDDGELCQFAAYYCHCPVFNDSPSEAKNEVENMLPLDWNIFWAKRQGFPLPTVRDLVKAGAIIAAEIDRRIRRRVRIGQTISEVPRG